MTTFSPEVQEILDRVKRGEEPPQKQRRPKTHGVGVLSNDEAKAELRERTEVKPKATKQRVYDYALIVSLHQTVGMSITDIAEYIGCVRSVVTNALNEAGVPIEDRMTALKPKEMCKRGLHSLDEHGVPKGKTRTCDPCQKMQRKIARLLRLGRDLTPEMLEFQNLTNGT